MVVVTNGSLIMRTVERGTMTRSPETWTTVLILRIRTTSVTRASIGVMLMLGWSAGTRLEVAMTTQTGRIMMDSITTAGMRKKIAIMTAGRASQIISSETSRTIVRPTVTAKTKTRTKTTEMTEGIFTTTPHKGYPLNHLNLNLEQQQSESRLRCQSKRRPFSKQQQRGWQQRPLQTQPPRPPSWWRR